MNLTSPATLIVAAAVTVVTMAGTVTTWPMLRRPRVLQWLARLLAIALCQATAICALGLWINDHYALYSSWSEVLNGPGGYARVSPGQDPATVVFQHRPDGLLETNYRGYESGLRGDLLVWTPPQYTEPAYRQYRFPVIMFLHGIPGSPQSWIRGGQILPALTARMRDHRLAPAVVVLPQIDPGGNTDCTNIPHGAQTATWLARDVFHLVTRRFRVLDQPSGWALAGDSTGGYCAVELPLQYPGTFGMGLAFSPDNFNGDPDAVANKTLRIQDAPIRLVTHEPRVSLFLATSTLDPYSPPANVVDLYNAARTPTLISPPLVLNSGGHNWDTWQAMYPSAFNWLAQRLTPPTPDQPQLPQNTGLCKISAPPITITAQQTSPAK